MSIIIVGVGPAEFDGESWTKLDLLYTSELVRFNSMLVSCFPSLLNVFTVISIPFPAAMVELDGDEVRISSRGRYAERDIVQVRRLSVFTLKASIKVIHLWVYRTFLS